MPFRSGQAGGIENTCFRACLSECEAEDLHIMSRFHGMSDTLKSSLTYHVSNTILIPFLQVSKGGVKEIRWTRLDPISSKLRLMMI